MKTPTMTREDWAMFAETLSPGQAQIVADALEYHENEIRRLRGVIEGPMKQAHEAAEQRAERAEALADRLAKAMAAYFAERDSGDEYAHCAPTDTTEDGMRVALRDHADQRGER